MGFTTIEGYVQDQFEDPAFTANAEFTAMVNAVTAVLTEITNLPNKGIGSTFTPVETAALKAALLVAATESGL